MRKQETRIPILDGIRGWAILLVLINHYFKLPLLIQSDSWSAKVLSILNLTWSGVDLFFVLSGFLLGGILMDHRDSPNYFKTFYIRRACRILPVYFLWVAITFWSGHADSVKAFPWWSYFAFTQNFFMASEGHFGPPWLAPTWSLAIEEQFYIFLPLLIRYLPPKKLPFLLPCLVLVGPLFRMIFFERMPAYVLMPCRSDVLLLGVFAAWVVRNSKIVSTLRDQSAAWSAALWILIAGLLVMSFKNEYIMESSFLALYGIGLSWIALFYFVLLLKIWIVPGKCLRSACEWVWIRKLGMISYGVYLFHQGVHFLVHSYLFSYAPKIADLNEALAMVGSLGLTLILATLSYRFLEKPILAWGHRFQY